MVQGADIGWHGLDLKENGAHVTLTTPCFINSPASCRYNPVVSMDLYQCYRTNIQSKQRRQFIVPKYTKFFKEYKKMDIWRVQKDGLTIALASYSGRRWTEKDSGLRPPDFRASETGSWELEARGFAKGEGKNVEGRRQVWCDESRSKSFRN